MIICGDTTIRSKESFEINCNECPEDGYFDRQQNSMIAEKKNNWFCNLQRGLIPSDLVFLTALQDYLFTLYELSYSLQKKRSRYVEITNL